MSIHDNELESIKNKWKLMEMNDGPFNQGEPVPFNKRKKKTEGLFGGMSSDEIYDYVKDAVKSGDVVNASQLKAEMEEKGIKRGDIKVALRILPDILSDYGIVEEDCDCVSKFTEKKSSPKCDSHWKNKRSSSRSDKKWMQCFPNGKGGYKLVHWGDPNAKVTGDSGDTDRKKSFRARHNCGNNKKYSAAWAACRDW
jgi:hypothetical protein